MDWLTAKEAAERLGVKPATLYAYVSRGLLTREPAGDGGRSSRYLKGDVDALATRSRSGRTRVRDVIVESAVTYLDPAGRLSYRGVDAVTMAGAWPFERAASWLWTGTDTGGSGSWAADPAVARAGSRAVARMGAGTSAADRLRVAVAAMAAADPLRHDRRPEAVMVTARGLVAGMVASLPSVGADTPPPGAPLARVLWSRLSVRRPRRAEVAALDRALVLLADHELAASTFAVRVAAATWTDPYLAVLAGMAAVGGPLHGAAAADAARLVREVAGGTSAEAAVGARVRAGQTVPGFGHTVYTGPDPRAPALLAAVAAARPPAAVADAAQAILAVVRSRRGPHPNVDFALAVLTEAAGMATEAGEAVFAVARSAGWIAHAMEEYREPLRYRPRARYVGPAIGRALPG